MNLLHDLVSYAAATQTNPRNYTPPGVPVEAT